jgi:Tol biopolymer transport system component
MQPRRLIPVVLAAVLFSAGPARAVAPPLIPALPLPYALVSAVDGPGLYVVGVDGRGFRRLAGPAWLPSWSPDGRRLASVQGDSGDVVVTQVDTGQASVVGSGHRTVDATPSWSPDGTHLAYPGPGAVSFERDVWIADASGASPARQLARPGDEPEVAWGPDGRLATVGYGIVISAPDGSQPIQIDGGGNYGPLKWSPDGKMLLNLPDSTSRDLVIDADGSNPRMLADSARLGLSIYQADWAPSSRELVYYENAYRTGHTIIGVAPADGGPGREIATDAQDPAWSSRGAIAVIKDTQSVTAPLAGGSLFSDLVVMTPYGTGTRVVVRSTLHLSTPAWSPDGSMLAFVAR